jgi:O-antigen ligase
VWSTAAALGAAAVCGVAVSKGGRVSELVLAIAALGALFLITARVGVWTVLIWPVAAAALYPFLRLPHDHPIVTFDRAWVLASISCLILGRRAVRMSRPTRLVSLAFGWLVVSFGLRALFTSGPNLGFEAITTWLDAALLPVLLFMLARRLVTTRRRLHQLAASLALAGTVLASIGIAEKLLGFELASRTRGEVRFDPLIQTIRVSGPYPVPEVYGLSLVICLAATFYWMQVRRGNAYFLGVLLIGLQAVAISVTFFRAAWIAAVVVLVVALTRPRQYARTVAVVVFVAAAGFLAFTQLQQSQTFTMRTRNVANVHARIATYEQAIEIFRRNPFAGVGVDQYFNVASKLPEKTQEGIASVPYPHDSYLGVLAEQGLAGFLPLLASTFAVWFALGRLKKRVTDPEDATLSASGRAAATGYLLMSLPLYMVPYGPSTSFFAVFLGGALGRLDALDSGRAARRDGE